MGELYTITELAHDIWYANMDHESNCQCRYHVALEVIEEYLN